MKESFVKAVLNETPKHLHKMQKFGLQYMFFADSWFILHCMKELVNNGKLKLPTEEQKKSLTTMIVPNEQKDKTHRSKRICGFYYMSS